MTDDPMFSEEDDEDFNASEERPTPVNLGESTPDVIDMEDAHNWTMVEEAIDSYGLDASISEILMFLGEDITREGLIETPRRVIESWKELYGGYTADIEAMMTTFDKEAYEGMIVLRGIEFFSMCEHHMLPFTGVAHVGYIPNVKIVGISKLARLVDVYSRRLQNQERITTQITGALQHFLDPKGSACIIEGKHSCMGCRGVKKPGAIMMTSSLRGAFKIDPATRSEFFSVVKGNQ